MDITPLSSDNINNYARVHEERKIPDKQWSEHVSSLGLDSEESSLYSALLHGLSKGNLTSKQTETLEDLLKKLFNVKNVYLQNS
jgi:hypothetical protein